MTDIVLTDDAESIHRFMEGLLSGGRPQHKGKKFYVKLAEYFDVDHDSAMFPALVFLLQQRMDGAIRLVDTLENGLLHPTVRSAASATLNRVRKTFTLDLLQTDWQGAYNALNSAYAASSLLAMQPAFREYWPLVLPSGEQRQEAINRLGGLIDEAYEVIPSSIASPLINGLMLLKLMLTNLEAFGHEAFIRELFDCNSRLQISSAIIENCGDKDLIKSFRLWAGGIVGVMLTASAIFALPKTLSEAHEHNLEYKTYKVLVDELSKDAGKGITYEERPLLQDHSKSEEE